MLLQHIHPRQKVPVLQRGFKQGDFFALKQFGGLPDLLGLVTDRDFDTFRKMQLGQLAHLEAAFGERGQELILHRGIGIIGLADIVELARTFQRLLEARFAQITWHGIFSFALNNHGSRWKRSPTSN